jgi:hypothetical protein
VSSGTYAFGIVAIDGAKMHIRGGLVQGFNASAWIEETEVSIGGDDNTPHLIIAQGDIGLATCSINAHSVLASTFTGHTDTQWRRALWKVCLRNGTAVALLDMTPGVIDLKSWFGP